MPAHQQSEHNHHYPGQDIIPRVQLDYNSKPGYSSTTEACEKDLKTNVLKMIEVLIEAMNKSLQETEENTNKQKWRK